MYLHLKYVLYLCMYVVPMNCKFMYTIMSGDLCTVCVYVHKCACIVFMYICIYVMYVLRKYDS